MSRMVHRWYQKSAPSPTGGRAS